MPRRGGRAPGAHAPGCPYIAERSARVNGETLQRWAARRAAQFDESTPPPRTRPRGLPVPRVCDLTNLDAPEPAFEAWDRDGRIPPRCVLAQFVGAGLRAGVSGYVVAGLSRTGQTVHTELGAIGAPVPLDRLDGYRIVAEVRHGRATYVVFAPLTEVPS